MSTHTTKAHTMLLLILVASLLLYTNSASSPATCTETEGSCQFGAGTPSIALSNGVEMPKLAIGTCFRDTARTPDGKIPSNIPTNPNFFGFVNERTYNALTLALEMGYKHIDTALVYRSQKAIGFVLANMFMSGKMKREDVFITTKIFHGPMDGLTRIGSTLPLDEMTPEEVTTALDEHFELCLEELGVGYVDLMLLHWPGIMNSKDSGNAARRIAAWKVLEKMLSRGWARSIGVSNFSEEHLEQLMADGAKVRPMVNQIEASIYKQWDGIAEYCNKNNIALMAYSPLGLGKESLLNNSAVKDIAKKHGVEPSQVALRYLIQLGFAVLPMSSSEERLQLNMNIFSFGLDDEDMAKLTKLKIKDEGIGLPSPYDIA